MATAKYKELMLVCKGLALNCEQTKRCLIYKGMANGKYCRIVIHLHSEGRDIPTGILRKYVKDLGFNSVEEFREFLNKL